MDALQKLLIEKYKLSPEEANKYASMIHKGGAGGNNQDNLQTEAYGGAAKDEIARMDRLRKNALLFTDIAQRRARGEGVSVEHGKYYDQVMQAHRDAVASRAKTAMGQQASSGGQQVSPQLPGMAQPAAPNPAIQGQMELDQRRQWLQSQEDAARLARGVSPPAPNGPGAYRGWPTSAQSLATIGREPVEIQMPQDSASPFVMPTARVNGPEPFRSIGQEAYNAWDEYLRLNPHNRGR